MEGAEGGSVQVLQTVEKHYVFSLAKVAILEGHFALTLDSLTKHAPVRGTIPLHWSMFAKVDISVYCGG